MARLLSILLQRSDPRHPWGFSVRGGLRDGTPLTIDQVTAGTLAAQYLAPGDMILQIEKLDTRQLLPEHVEGLISRPGKSLDLLIHKGSGSVQPYTCGSLGRRGGVKNMSSDSGAGSSTNSGCDQRTSKQHYWERISNDHEDFCKEGFTRLESGANSPYKSRQPGHWRRCQSEEKFNPRFDNSPPMFSDGEERSRKTSDAASFNSSGIQSVWSPTSSDRLRTPTADYLYQEKKIPSNYNERQGDITFWEYSGNSGRQSSEPRTTRSESTNKTYQRQSDSHGYSSLSSERASTPKSNFSSKDAFFDFKESLMKKPSDFWADYYRDQQGKVRLGGLLSPTRNLDKVWKSANLSTKSEFKQSTSISEKTYSSSDGAKSFETYEHVNKTKETEKSSKIGNGGKEEVVEKTKKNKEYILANKDDVNGQPKEKKKIINDFKLIERVMDGEKEYCNKTTERSEEVTDSSTPVNFYDNVPHHGVVGSPPVKQAEWCDHSVTREQDVGVVNGNVRRALDEEVSSQSFSPLLGHDPRTRRWASSTPQDLDASFVFQQEEPLQESYLEVDIRSPPQTEIAFASTDDYFRRQSSQISGGGSPIPVSPQGDTNPPPPPPCPPAPPPPPPLGIPGAIPSVRLSTEIPDKRRSAYEPPAAIQNAMMTKDKKPFTYTPGGLDLSEIRSPRMARRISRNANAPDMAPCQSRPPPVTGQPLPPSALAAMQPQIAIPVLPQGSVNSPQLHHVTPPPPPHPASSSLQNLPSPPPPPPQPMSPQRLMNRQPSPPSVSVPKLQPQHRHTKSEPQSVPGSIYVPPIEPQQPRAQLGSLYIPPLAPQEPSKPQSPVPSQLNKAPTPWMSRQSQPVQKESPPWVNKENQQNSSPQSPPQHQSQQPQTRIIPIQFEGKDPPQQQVTRIIPIQMEGTPSPQHTLVQPNFNQQQQQYQQPQYQQQQYQQQQPYQPQYQQHPGYQQQQSYEQGRQTPRWMNQQPVYVHNKFNSGSQSPIPAEQNHGDNQPGWRHSQTNGTMQSPGPVQSPSFKVIEKTTGGVDHSDSPYNSQGVPLSQLRKLQLSDDDRALMNKVKSQVDDETYLHNESDPRYRGSAIPSRAFRILQTMTDSAGEESDVPRSYSPVQAGQNRLAANRTPQPDVPQQYIPPSEQQVPEPRKYTGGAIPSRSFRMLQAMTGSDSADRSGESEY